MSVAVSGKASERVRLVVEVEPESRQRVREAAARSGLSVREYLERVLAEALASAEDDARSAECPLCAGLSPECLDRDWDGLDDDQLYDGFAQG